ncbi:hypothetical protein CAEBREN_01330 [Caenorhabditis brenneri]|uniref:Uncharacterized protein n=1 Tax=Caenorhabditis brenneri TaxID=135651 RepID=G0MCT5_CAEBE|nr:hypothetical protein CAEBREN_01330 [Caenorhabditis brenneri]
MDSAWISAGNWDEGAKEVATEDPLTQFINQFQTTVTFFGITSALSSYYQEEKSMEPFAMATRLADITLLIAPIFNVYQDMLKMYHTLQIEDRFKEE